MSDVTVTNEPLTYEPDSPHSFFGDLARSKFSRDVQSEERLERHRLEVAAERRTMTTTTAGDLAMPMYMIDKFKTTARASRPLADLLNPMPLPRGTKSINIPRTIQTGIANTETATMVDAAAVNETDPTTATNSSNVVTIAGQLVVSQQLMDQGGAPGTDVIMSTELIRDYDAALEQQLLAGSGTGGQLVGLSQYTLPSGHAIDGSSATFASSTTGVQLLWPMLGKAMAAIGNDRGRLPEVWLMAPRRWAVIAASLDNQNRPLASPGTGSYHMEKISPDAGHQGAFGPLLNIPVYCDGAIPASAAADTIYCLRPEDMYLFESEPTVSLNFDTSTSSTLGVRVVFHASVAFVGNLYTTSVAKITGLPQPSGF